MQAPSPSNEFSSERRFETTPPASRPKLFYIYPEALPSAAARTTAVVKSCESLSRFCDLTLVTTLQSRSRRTIEKAYGVNLQNVRLVRLPRRLLFFHSNAIFNFFLLRTLPRHERVILIVRHLKATAFLLRHKRPNWTLIFESHELFHATAVSPRKRHKLKALEASAYRQADGLIFITQTLQEDAQTAFKFPASTPQITLHSATDVPPQMPAKNFTSIDEVFYVGSLMEWKGVDDLIKAFAEVPAPLHLTLIGNGEPQRRRQVQEQINALGLKERAHLLPREPHACITHRLRTQTKLCVIPNNHTPFERYSSPLKLFEYMAAGNIIIYTRIPTLLEIEKFGEFGIGVEPGNPAALAQAIRQVCQSPATYVHLAQKAYELSKQFSWDKRAEQIVKFAQEIGSK